MKALSLKQPFAELILQGRKKIELRKWNTNFRGEFLIHSSKIPDEQAMKMFGFVDLPCGFVLGKVNLVHVKKYEDDQEYLKDRTLHLASSKWGDYGFVLECPERLHKLPVQGRLNFWDYNMEDKIEKWKNKKLNKIMD